MKSSKFLWGGKRETVTTNVTGAIVYEFTTGAVGGRVSNSKSLNVIEPTCIAVATLINNKGGERQIAIGGEAGTALYSKDDGDSWGLTFNIRNDNKLWKQFPWGAPEPGDPLYGKLWFSQIVTTDGIITDPVELWPTTHLYQNEPFSCMAYGNGEFVGISAPAVTEGRDETWQKKLPERVTHGRIVTCDVWGIWRMSEIPDYPDSPAKMDDQVTTLVYGDGKFVAGTEKGYIYWFSDVKSQWHRVESPFRFDGKSTTIRQIIYEDGKFVAVGDRSAFIAYSFDGITWYFSDIMIANSRSNQLTGVAYDGDGRFIIVGMQGTVLTSKPIPGQ
jgi:hypothetical protein